MKINISLDLDEDCDELVSMFYDADHDDIIKFICNLDLRIAEVDFTAKLIKALAKSLESDLSEEEIKKLFNNAD